MELLIVRHAEAEEFSMEGDAGRALSRAGLRKMHLAAQGLSRFVKHIDLLAYSPLLRAQQTARVLADYYDAAQIQALALLAPGVKAVALNRWLGDQPADAVIALVGHEPDLSGLISAWCANDAAPFVKMKKGSVCRLGFEGPPSPGRALLHWLLTAGQLARMAE